MAGVIELTVRKSKAGGGLTPIESKFGRPRGYTRLTVWIHGYNNSEYRSRDIWEGTHDRVRYLAGLESLEGLVWFFWPGDAHPSRLISAPLYFMEVQDALDAGDSLAAYLASIAPDNPGLRINIVAHSLGARVALRSAAILPTLGGPPVDKLLLFAPAVPEGLCANGKSYSGPLARSEVAVWSLNDNVLRRAFRVGQFLARRFRGDEDPGKLRSAVGYSGGPPGRWEGRKDSIGYGHGDYWQKDLSLALVARIFRTTTAPRDTGQRGKRTRTMGSRRGSSRVLVRRRPRTR